MKTFQDFLRMKEELWHTAGPQDNPSNPGTKRKDAKDPYNHRFGGVAGGAMPLGGAGPGMTANPMPNTGKKMAKK